MDPTYERILLFQDGEIRLHELTGRDTREHPVVPGTDGRFLRDRVQQLAGLDAASRPTIAIGEAIIMKGRHHE